MTRKDPEYYPQGGVHLKHAAIPPHMMRTVSGISPLTISASRPVSIMRMTVYGNSLNGKGVGDKTSNLFHFASATVANGSISERSSSRIIATGRESADPQTPVGNGQYANGWLKIAGIDNIAKGTTVTLSADIRFIEKHPDHINKFIFRIDGAAAAQMVSVNSSGHYVQTLTTTSSITSATEILISLNSSTIEISNIMVNVGDSAGYEPYGYRIPVKVQNSFSEVSSVFYTDAPLYTLNDTFATSCYGLQLYPGNNILTVNTSVSPSYVEVVYSAP